MVDRPPPGLSEVSTHPSWTGTLQGGGNFELYGAAAGRSTKSKPHGQVFRSKSTMRGHAYASITMPIGCPLSFHRDAPARRRVFTPWFAMVPWTDLEEFEFTEDQTVHQGVRSRLILRAEPLISVYPGSIELATSNGAWIIDDSPGTPELERIASDSAEDARTFLSFLVGRNLPFYWRDIFPNGVQIRRLYIGASRATADVVGNEQPLPLNNVREAFGQGSKIGPKLPELFSRFKAVRENYNLEFVMSPTWTAFDGHANDKLALACVSFERLSTAHADHLEELHGERPKAEFLTRPQFKALLNSTALSRVPSTSSQFRKLYAKFA